MAGPTKVNVDFSDVESRGGEKSSGRRIHVPAGDYAAKIKQAQIVKSSEKKTPGIRVDFIITQGKQRGKVIWDNFWLTESSLWRVRQLLEAAGIKVPNRKTAIDVVKLKGKELAITLDDDEYDDRVYSRVVDTFRVDILEEGEDEGDDDEGDDEEEEDEDEDEDEEDEEDDDEEDDDEDEEEEESSDEDDDLEGIDLDDI